MRKSKTSSFIRVLECKLPYSRYTDIHLIMSKVYLVCKVSHISAFVAMVEVLDSLMGCDFAKTCSKKKR
jgi:hypothetical protein